MKTTLEIPDDLFRRTKAEAALRGRPMKDLVIEALEEKLRARPGRGIAGWRSVFGKTTRAAVRDVDRRIAQELERVDLEDWK